MKANYINELAEGMKVDDPFAVRAKEMRAARTGDAFLSLELADRTGQLPAVYFRPDPAGVCDTGRQRRSCARDGDELPRPEAHLG